MSRRANCPQCGAPIQFRFAQAVQTVCSYCNSVLVRHDVDLCVVVRGEDDLRPAFEAFRKVVEELDPGRIYLPTSPSGPVFGADPAHKGEMHDVHGNWKYLGNPEHYRFFNEIDPLLHSEFGCEGAANLSTLRRILSEENLWPPDGTNPAWVHHGAWWLNREAVEALIERLLCPQ